MTSSDLKIKKKRRDRSPLMSKILSLLATLVTRLIYSTLRWSKVGFEGDEAFWPEKSPRILCFWHGRQLFMPWIYKSCIRNPKDAKPIFALISAHSDGRLISEVVGSMGIFTVEGSSTRGGREALFKLIKTLREGSHIAITPDGPKGPHEVVKGGVIRIAQKAGVPIYPVALGYERAWRINSWDSMFIPKPFSRAVYIMGKAINIPSTLSSSENETYRETLERELLRLSKLADNYFKSPSLI